MWQVHLASTVQYFGFPLSVSFYHCATLIFSSIQWNLPLTEPGHNGNLSLAENLYNLKDPNSDTCIKRKLPAIGKISVPCGSVTAMFHCTILIRPEGKSGISVSTVTRLHATPGLLRLWWGTDNCRKVWSAWGQHELEYTEWSISKYTYNFACIILPVCLSIHHVILITVGKTYLKMQITT
jgi:hypothetical protein